MGTPINSIKDPNTDLRYYQWADKKLISVTSIRRQLGMPDPLVRWQIEQIIGAAESMRGTDLEASLDSKAYKKALRKGGTQVRDKAATLGTSIHEAAEQGLDPQSMGEEDPRKPFLEQYQLWKAEMRPDIYMSEEQVFNLTEGYAGSLDMIADVRGRRYIIDLKTGKGTYPEHALQLGLYMGAEFIGAYDKLTEQDVTYAKKTEIFREVDGIAILHLRPDEWSWRVISFTDELAAGCLNMVRLAHWFSSYPTIDTLIQMGSQYGTDDLLVGAINNRKTDEGA